MKRFLYLTLFLVLVLSGCAPERSIPEVVVPVDTVPANVPPTAAPLRTLNVFAAASLTDALIEIGQAFERVNPGVVVAFNFADSQSLQTQIAAGAPADVFASANKSEMDNLAYNNFITQGASQVFTTNKLVVVLSPDNPAGLAKLEDLGKPGIKLALAAEDVPVGGNARQALDQMNGSFGSDFKDKVLTNVVSNESDGSQVVTKVQSGEADAGIVYTSEAAAGTDLKTIEIPAGSNVIAKYLIAPISKSANADLAAAFVGYVFSPDGQAILQKWGFGK